MQSAQPFAHQPQPSGGHTGQTDQVACEAPLLVGSPAAAAPVCAAKSWTRVGLRGKTRETDRCRELSLQHLWEELWNKFEEVERPEGANERWYNNLRYICETPVGQEPSTNPDMLPSYEQRLWESVPSLNVRDCWHQYAVVQYNNKQLPWWVLFTLVLLGQDIEFD
jgi:hypothetical protein